MKKTGLVFATLISGLVLIFLIVGMIQDFHVSYLIITAVLTYAVFSFVFCLFYESAIQDILLFWLTRTIRWPGLIFTFDLDGFIWLIGMKILFAVLGFLAGVACAAFGIVISLVCAPFVFPYALVQARRG